MVLLGGEAGVNGDASKLLSARPPARAIQTAKIFANKYFKTI